MIDDIKKAIDGIKNNPVKFSNDYRNLLSKKLGCKKCKKEVCDKCTTPPKE